MMKFIWIGFGGFLGSVARFGVSQITAQFTSFPFPIATLIVNSAGCFAIGYLFEFLRGHHLQPTLWFFLSVGFLGAFTTFSTFSLETLQLIRGQSYVFAFLNITGSLVLCFAGVFLGTYLGSR